MGEAKVKMGTIGWVDLTVDNADDVRDFYKAVVGWTNTEVSMGDYCDYAMMADPETAVGGVCHARGANAGLPAKWLMYVNIPDLAASLEACKAKGGKVIAGPKSMGEARYAVIEDPAGAVMALFQPE